MPAVNADTLTLPRYDAPGLEAIDRPIRSLTTAPLVARAWRSLRATWQH
jgi:hypothetical protein